MRGESRTLIRLLFRDERVLGILNQPPMAKERKTLPIQREKKGGNYGYDGNRL